MRGVILSGLILLGALAGDAPAVAAPPVELGTIQLATRGPITRVEIEVSARPRFETFLMDDPYRAIIALSDTRVEAAGDPPRVAGLVAGLRLTTFEQQSRVVLDLERPARVRSVTFQSRRSGGALVVELEPVAIDIFRALARDWAPSGEPIRAAVRPGPAARFVAPAQRPIVMLDAGHGGHDPGTTSPHGMLERDVTLAMARAVAHHLAATRRFRPRLTREGDHYLELRDRVRLAREAGAALFVSLHADAHDDPEVSGVSVYTLSETASDGEAEALARRENRETVAGVDLRRAPREAAPILLDIAQRATMNRSVSLARVLLDELGHIAPLLPRNPHRNAGFAVLRAPDVPSVLVELGYMSNRQDESRLANPRERDRLARGIAQAIARYLDDPR